MDLPIMRIGTDVNKYEDTEEPKSIDKNVMSLDSNIKNQEINKNVQNISAEISNGEKVDKVSENQVLNDCEVKLSEDLKAQGSLERKENFAPKVVYEKYFNNELQPTNAFCSENKTTVPCDTEEFCSSKNNSLKYMHEESDGTVDKTLDKNAEKDFIFQDMDKDKAIDHDRSDNETEDKEDKAYEVKGKRKKTENLRLIKSYEIVQETKELYSSENNLRKDMHEESDGTVDLDKSSEKDFIFQDMDKDEAINHDRSDNETEDKEDKAYEVKDKRKKTEHLRLIKSSEIIKETKELYSSENNLQKEMHEESNDIVAKIQDQGTNKNIDSHDVDKDEASDHDRSDNETADEEDESYEVKIKRRRIKNEKLLKSLGIYHSSKVTQCSSSKRKSAPTTQKERAKKRQKSTSFTLTPTRYSRRLLGEEPPNYSDDAIENDDAKYNSYAKYNPIKVVTQSSTVEKRENFFGPVPGVAVGTEFNTRIEASHAGVHRPNVSGIHGSSNGCYSIALSGGYEDDVDLGYSFAYTGEGGRDLRGTKANPKNLRTAPQSKDQVLERGNLALVQSYEKNLPIRVIRGYKLKSEYAPKSGYRYDGLYKVERYYLETGRSGFKVYKFLFRRLDNQEPAPWLDKQNEGLQKEKESEKQESSQQNIEVMQEQDSNNQKTEHEQEHSDQIN